MPSNDLRRPKACRSNVIAFHGKRQTGAGHAGPPHVPRRLLLAGLLAFAMPLSADQRLEIIAELLRARDGIDD
jgi:hypothetical protein